MQLSANEISFAHGPRRILSCIDLSFDPAEITAILGPNGSGKSTFLSILSGQQRPGQGEITLDGRPLSQWGRKPLARALAVLPQQPQAPEDILVRDLVAHGRFAHRRPLVPLSEADHHAIDEALRQTGTEGFASRPFQALSGGERQRVWLALALAQAPRWLLLDEPTSFLDMGHQYQVLSVLKSLNRGRAIGIVMVLHDVNQASLFADRIIALSGGRIVADGPPGGIITADLIDRLYGLRVNVVSGAASAPVCVPDLDAVD
ncbi:MAG: ABC transporter ATP-binding protein [Pseudomonadota bacterium]